MSDTESSVEALETPVLLVFFVRESTFSQVFEAVRHARPKTLLLWQDGPRKNRPEDVIGIESCRAIAESVDWECTVYKHYCEENQGCDPSTFNAFKWAFTLVDKCIILEDDQVPGNSFFWYCQELLNMYEFDDRINHICGYNPYGEIDWCDSDYVFGYSGTGAWASWKRVAKGWDEHYLFLNDEYSMRNLEMRFGEWFNGLHDNAIKRKSSGIAYWETIIGMDCLLNSRLTIIPKVNLVTNLGLASANATHSSLDDPTLLKSPMSKELGFAHDITFPLTHPHHVVADERYMKLIYSNTSRSKLRKMQQDCITAFAAIRNGRYDLLRKAIQRRTGSLFR